MPDRQNDGLLAAWIERATEVDRRSIRVLTAWRRRRPRPLWRWAVHKEKLQEKNRVGYTDEAIVIRVSRFHAGQHGRAQEKETQNRHRVGKIHCPVAVGIAAMERDPL